MVKFIENMFSKEKINNGRQLEVDLIRGFALIIICLCHVGLFLTTDTSSGMYYFADIIGSEPVAPVLMIITGLSIIYSRKQKPSDFLRRGIILFLGSYLLNLYRSFPYWITGDLDYFACVSGFFVVDILQFVGLTFMIFGLFKKIKMSSPAIFMTSLVFLMIGQVLMSTPNALDFPKEATYVLNLFLPLNNNWCCFNLSTWLFYPSFGLLLGELLIRCKNKDKFYLILLLVGAIGAIALYLNIGLRFPNYTSYYYGDNFYRMGLLNTIIASLFTCFLLAICHFFGKVLPKCFKNYLSFLSKNVTKFYIFTWVFLAPLIHVQARYELEINVMTTVTIMLVLIVICSLFTLLYVKIKSSIINRKLKKC